MTGWLRHFHPGHGPVFLWLPLLFLLIFVRLIVLPTNTMFSEGWREQLPLKKQSIYYVRAKIKSVFKPGTYLAEMQLLEKKRKYRHKFSNQNYQERNLKKIKKQKIPHSFVYLQINDYYLVSGCRLWLNLKRNKLPQSLPQSGFGQYLQKSGAKHTLRISRKQIYRKSCRNLDLRGKFQDALGRTLYKSGFSLHQRSVALGLILGRASYMQKELKQKATELGILHLFAASGLHMGIFFLWFYWPLSRLCGKKSYWALSLPLIPCFGYMFLLGFPLSLVRAFTFLSFHALQSFVYRKISIHDLLLNSALTILFIQPQNFISIGSMLSFGAVSGILYFYPILQRSFLSWKTGILNPFLQQATISITASLLTLPIIIQAFGGYSYFSLVANMILVPFVALLMPVLIGGISIGLVSGGVILIFAKLAREVTQVFISLTQWLSQFSYYIRYESLLCLPFLANGFLLISLLGLYYCHHQKRKVHENIQRYFIASSVCCIILLSPVTGVILDNI